MTKQEEIRGIIWRSIPMPEGSMSDHYNKTVVVDRLIKDLDEKGIVIKGQSLGISHPHLASYYTVEPLIKKC